MDSTLVLASLAAGLSLICVYYHVKVFSFWSSRGIPGPTPWPIYGTMIYYAFKTRIDLDLEWRQRYGKVYGVYEGYYPALRISDNELIKHVWVKEHKSFVDRNTKFTWGKNISRWLFFSKGDHWNNQRVLISPLFTSSKMKSMLKITVNCADRFIQNIKTRFENNNNRTSDKEKELRRSDLMCLTLDVISRSFFSLNLNTYRDKSSEFYKRAYAFAKFDVGYMFVYFAIPSFVRKYFKIDLTRPYKYEYFDKLSDGKIKQRRLLNLKENTPTLNVTGDTLDAPDQPANDKKPNDLIQYLIGAMITDENIYTQEDDLEAKYNDQIDLDKLEGIHKAQQAKKLKFRKFDDLEIRSQMTFFFLAGFETTASSLSIIIYELCHQQELQEKIYQELKENNIDNDMDYGKLSDLKLLEAFISESLRVHAPVTENNRIVTDKNGVYLPTKPNPLYLPYDTTISAVAFVLQRDPDYWPEPDKFDITRFFPENKSKIKSCTYMPFGLGPRNCAGMRFALLTIKTTIVKLLLNYKLSPGPKSQIYPPKYKQHGFFTQLKDDEFLITPRENHSNGTL